MTKTVLTDDEVLSIVQLRNGDLRFGTIDLVRTIEGAVLDKLGISSAQDIVTRERKAWDKAAEYALRLLANWTLKKGKMDQERDLLYPLPEPEPKTITLSTGRRIKYAGYSWYTWRVLDSNAGVWGWVELEITPPCKTAEDFRRCAQLLEEEQENG